VLSVKLESYPNVSLLDSGMVVGRNSLSHIADASGDLRDPKACPARPVTATTLRFLSVIRIHHCSSLTHSTVGFSPQ
jgi:hypothetical protein